MNRSLGPLTPSQRLDFATTLLDQGLLGYRVRVSPWWKIWDRRYETRGEAEAFLELLSGGQNE